MKTKPNNTTPAPKTYYVLEIDNQQFSTYATSAQSAISNAAYQYATRAGEDVRLVRWQIGNGELVCKIVEPKQ